MSTRIGTRTGSVRFTLISGVNRDKIDMGIGNTDAEMDHEQERTESGNSQAHVLEQ